MMQSFAWLLWEQKRPTDPKHDQGALTVQWTKEMLQNYHKQLQVQCCRCKNTAQSSVQSEGLNSRFLAVNVLFSGETAIASNICGCSGWPQQKYKCAAVNSQTEFNRPASFFYSFLHF